MPDKPPTPWSADEAFWNDAWQDMDHRLQQGHRRRSPLPWLLLALLLVGLIGAGTQVQWTSPKATDSTTSAPPIARHSHPPTPASAPTVGPRAELYATDGIAPTSDQNNGQVAGATTTSTAPARPAQPDALPGSPTEAAVVTLLPTLSPQMLAVTLHVPQPEHVTEITPVEKPVRLVVALGASTYTLSRQLGGFAEVDYLLGRGRWQFPLALRYDYGARDVRANPPTQQELYDLLGSPGNLSYVDPTSASEVLYTHELSLRTGVVRALDRGGRLTLGGGVSLRYVLAGEGPVVSGVPGVGALERADLSSAATFSSASPLANGFGLYLDPRIHRWGVDGWLQLRYRLAGSWGLSFGTSHTFSRVYREGRLDVDRTRVEIGLSKGF